MSTYNVGSDHSGNGDQECIDAVCRVLEDAGHTANKLGVTPNLEGSLNTGNGEDIGVFIVNGICLGTIASVSKMVQGGGCSHVYFGIPKPIMSSPFNVEANLTDPSMTLAIADDDNFSPPDVRALDKKFTVAEAFDHFEGVSYVYGNTCEEVGQKILNGDVGGGNSSTSDKNEGSVMSGWESITDLLKPLDGEAMVVVRGDAVIVKRIYPPESAQLWVYEGINVVSDSVKVSDYSPEIYNTFVIKWGASFENQFEISFNKHKELFGERKTEVNAIYTVPIDKTNTGEETETDTGETQSNDDGGIFGFITDTLLNWGTGGTYGTVKASANVIYDSEGDAYGGGTGEEAQEEEEPTLSEIPITDEGEAYLFGLMQVGKACRKSGHQIECKVIGNKRFEVGEWCRVYLPTFREDCIMFISKVSNESSADGEWLTSLTLVDYPPSLGSGQSNSPTADDENAESTEGGDNEFVGDPSNPDATVDDAEAGDVNTNTGDV